MPGIADFGGRDGRSRRNGVSAGSGGLRAQAARVARRAGMRRQAPRRCVRLSKRSASRRFIGAIVNFGCSYACSHAVRKNLGRPRGSTKSRRERRLLYIDLHLVHEVTSPQAFEGLRLAGRRVGGPT